MGKYMGKYVDDVMVLIGALLMAVVIYRWMGIDGVIVLVGMLLIITGLTLGYLSARSEVKPK